MKILSLMMAAMLMSGCTYMMPVENKRADQEGKTIVGMSLARAKDKVCMDNLRSVRQAIEVYKTSDDGNPPDLTVLKLPAEMLVDPIGKEPYEYDVETGEVKCVHPGHKKY